MYDPKIGRWLSEDPKGLTVDANPYRYVRNSPTNYTDPEGTDITLETGNNTGNPCNDALHQQVCVDIWDAYGNKKGEKCYSFATIEDTGILSPIWSTGEVYVTQPVPGAGEAGHKTTTPAQDAAFEKYMDGMVKAHVTGPYSVVLPGRKNCRDFSQDEFNKAPGRHTFPPTLTPPHDYSRDGFHEKGIDIEYQPKTDWERQNEQWNFRYGP